MEGERGGGEPWITALFSTKEAAEMAKAYYDSRKISYSRYYYEIQKWEVLDQATIQQGQRPSSTTMGTGLDSVNVPATGAG